MPMPIIPKALYPLVPNLPGVPVLLRSGAVIVDALTGNLFGLTDAFDSFFGTNPIQWGIFDESGNQVVQADSVVSLAARNGTRLVDYPLEEGAFATYNKVAEPYFIRVRMTRGGTEEQRAQFLLDLEAASASLELYTVMTPEITYTRANIEGFEYIREARNGANLITADIALREIRNTVTTAFNVPKSIDGADQQSAGQVQTFPVTQSVVKATELGPLQ